jgi:hypothetical protein
MGNKQRHWCHISAAVFSLGWKEAFMKGKYSMSVSYRAGIETALKDATR